MATIAAALRDMGVTKGDRVVGVYVCMCGCLWGGGVGVGEVCVCQCEHFLEVEC